METKSKKNKGAWTIIAILMLIGIALAVFFWLNNRKKKTASTTVPATTEKPVGAAEKASEGKILIANSNTGVITAPSSTASSSMTTIKTF